jgi:nuclear GTP-binding protein
LQFVNLEYTFSNKSQSSVPIEFAKQNLLTSANCLGADILLKLLKTYTNVNDVKQTITVGVVGKIK